MSDEDGRRIWFEEDLADGHRWQMLLKRIIHTGKSKFQDVEIVETVPYGTMLLLDGKMQSSEADEWAYHETLVHIAMLHHPNPKSVFIMGGGEGATAREILRHKTVEKVVMVDIDEVVCRFCAEHIPSNTAAFKDPRLTLVHDDAGPQLENWPGTFDVIISDLADPVYGGPCYHLYTQEFYRDVVQKKLNPGGIFIAQAGPAGMLSATETWTSIGCTLRTVFPKVLSYHAHFPSFCDEWGFHMCLPEKEQALLEAGEFDKRAESRINGELRFVDGQSLQWFFNFSKSVRLALENEQHIYTKDNPKFLSHGQGIVKESK